MPLTNEATHQKWIKATEEWTQEFRKGPWSLPNVMHFDRNFSIDDMTWRRLGNLMFNVKLKTNFSVDPIVIIETGSKETGSLEYESCGSMDPWIRRVEKFA